MKASPRDLELAVDMTMKDIRGDLPYYSGPSKLDFFPGSRANDSIPAYNRVDGTQDVLESFALHLAIILSGEAYAVGNTGYPTMVEIHDVLGIRKELLSMASVYDATDDEPATFDLWIDEA